jgi:GNAT superfamily N-acetyltransferase
VHARVRRAVAGDADGIASCQGACWREAYGGLVGPGFFDDEADGIGGDRWGQIVRDPGVDVAVAVVAEQDGDVVVGFASAGPPAAGPSEPDGSAPPRDRQLYAMYVRARLHGTGVADQLLGSSLGTGPAHLWVFEENPRAQAFYARHGFVPDGARAIDDWTGQPEVRLVR